MTIIQGLSLEAWRKNSCDPKRERSGVYEFGVQAERDLIFPDRTSENDFVFSLAGVRCLTPTFRPVSR